MNSLLIVGAGKLGREVFNWATQTLATRTDLKVEGFLDSRGSILSEFTGYPPIISSVEDYTVRDGDRFLIAVGDPLQRALYFDLIRKQDGLFATLIHPSAVISKMAIIGAGTIVCPFCHVSCNARIGNNVFLGTHSNVGHDCRIGDHCQISGSCELNGNCILGSGVFVGSHSTILPEAHLGDRSFVGAHSAVLRKVANNSRVFGVPAVEI